MDGEEYELVQLPRAVWDPNLIVIQEGSSSSDKQGAGLELIAVWHKCKSETYEHNKQLNEYMYWTS